MQVANDLAQDQEAGAASEQGEDQRWANIFLYMICTYHSRHKTNQFVSFLGTCTNYPSCVIIIIARKLISLMAHAQNAPGKMLPFRGHFVVTVSYAALSVHFLKMYWLTSPSRTDRRKLIIMYNGSTLLSISGSRPVLTALYHASWKLQQKNTETKSFLINRPLSTTFHHFPLLIICLVYVVYDAQEVQVKMIFSLRPEVPGWFVNRNIKFKCWHFPHFWAILEAAKECG